MSFDLTVAKRQHNSTIFLHGFAGTPYDWHPVLDATQLGGTALCLPGHHPHCEPATDFPSAVQQLLPRCPSSPFDLVGYSLGGRIALAMSALAPKRIRRLVLIAVNTGLEDESERLARRQQDAQRAQQLLNSPESFFAAWDQLPMFKGPETPWLAPWQARRSQLDHVALSRVMTHLSLGDMPLYRKEFFRNNIPCLLIVGDQDHKALAHTQTLMAAEESTGKTEFRLIHRAAHRVLVDAPKTLGQALDTWLLKPS